MTNPYAALQSPAVIADSVQQSFERGAKQAREREIRRTAAQAMAGDENALAKLYGLDPGMGANIEEQIHQRGERQRASDYRSAVGDIMLGGGAAPGMNALGALGPQATPSWNGGAGANALMRFAPPQPGNTMAQGQGGLTARTAAPSPYAGPMASPGIGDGIPGQAPAGAPGPRSDAMARAIRANPEGFLKVQGQMTELTQDKLKLAVDINDFGMQLLGGVHDQPSYDMAKRRAAEVYQQHGIPFPELPAEYSPDAIRGLQMQGMDTSKQLAAIVRENRLDWDMQDDALDNQRADRNADSLISSRKPRNGPRSAAPKGPTPTSVIGAIMDKQAKGQPLTPAERQTLTEYRAGKGRGKASGAIAESADGRQMVVKGGKWVYQDTGKPVE